MRVPRRPDTPTYLDPWIEGVLQEGLRREGWPRPARAHVADRGGLTRGGITAANWGDWLGLGRSATAAELDAITEPEALQFYFWRYVAFPRFDQILDQRLRALAIDWAFTSWSDDPWRAIQASLKRRGLDPGPIDGIVGPRTLAALHQDREPRVLFRDVFNARLKHYVRLAHDASVRQFLREHPASQLHNLAGWVNRALEFTP